MAINLLQLPGTGPQALLHRLAESTLARLGGVREKAHPLHEVTGCTLGLLRDPYRFVMKTCARLGSDAFQGRLFWRRTIFMMGQEAAEHFYNAELFMRRSAVPLRLTRLLFGRGGVQTLDGDEHRRRKALFMALVANPEQALRLAHLAGRELRVLAQDWPERAAVDLYAELRTALTRAACLWAGVPLPEEEVPQRTAQLAGLLEPRRLFGPPHWRRWWRRLQAERWGMALVRAVRNGELEVPLHSALFEFSRYQDSGGRPLPPRSAAVELLNVLRPVVAVSVYGVYCAMALARHPEYRERLQQDDEFFLQAFVQEVRRFYPFFPLLAARTRRTFEWRGRQFPAGAHVLLDLYGTNHDTRLWEAPDIFHPERFFYVEPGAFTLLPQGGGDARMQHRCPAETLTLALMKELTLFLAREIRYDLATAPVLDWQRLPPLPGPEFLLANVRAAAPVRRSAPARLGAAGGSGRRPAMH